MRRTDTLIIGGGPAGAMAAIALAQAGQRALLLERTRQAHDVVCGGFLGWDTLAILNHAGIDVAALGARPVTQLHLVAGQRSALIDLPYPAAGLSRAALDATLLRRAAELGTAVEHGIAVRHHDPETHLTHLADGAGIAARAIFLATGKHNLRGVARDIGSGEEAPIGMRLRLGPSVPLSKALAGRIELILFDRGYAGLILQEDGAANLAFTVSRSRLDEAGGNRDQLLDQLAAEAPILAERLGQADGLSGWASIARVPYGWRTSETRPGLFRLGDQAAVIASLAGDGIAIALTSAHMAVDHWRRHGAQGALRFQTAFAKAARRPLWIAERLRSMAESGGMAPIGVGALTRFPAAARAAARATRIGAY